MAMINLGQPLYPIALRCSGQIGHVYIFQQHGNWRRICPYYYPYNPRTAKQQAHRKIYGQGVGYWRTFDAQTKNYYNRLVRSQNMTGVNKYLQLYLRANKSV